MAKSGTQIAAVRTTRKGATIHKTNERPGTRAQVRYVRVSASKAREVLDLIRGKHVQDAAEILEFVERDVARVISKALDSAVANAANNDGQDPEALFVSACYADEGPTLRRWRPRARGRATRIRKRTCHITIIVSRLDEMALRIRTERLERTGGSAGSESRASRRARVARSRQAEAAEATDDDQVEAVDTVGDETVEDSEATTAESPDTDETTDSTDTTDEEVAEATADDGEADETDEKDED